MYTLTRSQDCIDTNSVIANLDTLRTINSMETWQDRTRLLMKKKGVTQEALTQVLCVSTRGAVGHYLSGRREPSISQLRSLADFFKVDFSWLVSGNDTLENALIKGEIHAIPEFRPEFRHLDESAAANTANTAKTSGNPNASDELEFFGRMDAWDSNTPLDDDEVELPLFREVELAAGAGQTEVIENHGAKLRFAKSTLARAGVQKENAACAFVRGNSMEPVMPNGTCVGVNTGDTAVRDGEIYAIDHDGMLRVKYLHRRPGGGIKIVSQNAIEHEPEDYSAQKVAEENIRVIGRVFWWSVLR